MLKAIIFDFDGVICNSEPTHFAVFQRVLAEENLELTETQYFNNYLAMDDKGAFSSVLRDRGRSFTDEVIVDLIKRKAHYFDEIMAESVALYVETADFIKRVNRRWPIAINSGALRHEIEMVLNRAQLASYFTLIVSSEDITNCKPDPEGYLLALARLNEHYPELNAKPEECLVIEDSVGGVKSGNSAGMKCVAVTNTYAAEQLQEAAKIVGSLAELSDEDLVILFE